MSDRIYMSAPDIGALEEEYILGAVRSGWIAPLGPDVDKFEMELAERVGRKYGIALSSGTAALHLALLANGVRPGTVVLTSSMTFAATANAIKYTGAEPYFIDCLYETGNIDPDLLERTLKSLTAAGEKISGIVPVDLLGKCVNYSAIKALADEYEIPVIADAAESLGASHAGRPAGAWGDAAIFSFNGNKIMTTSGGGMVLTDDPRVATQVRYLATQARQPALHYEHTELGYNYRLSNLLAALGRAQLSRLDDMIARRRHNRELYREVVRQIPGLEIFGADDDAEDNCWLTSLIVDATETGYEAVELIEALSRHDIESRPLWKPMHLQPLYKGARCLTNGSSEHLFRRGITLPSGSKLNDEQVQLVASVISDFSSKTR